MLLKESHEAIKEGIYCLNAKVRVLAKKNGVPTALMNRFGKGRTMYLTSFRTSPEATRFLFRAILELTGREELMSPYICSNLMTECAFYPDIRRIVVINNSEIRGDDRK